MDHPAGPVPWTVKVLLRDLAARGGHPAVISFGAGGVETWDSASLADNARRLAQGLQRAGVRQGTTVALWAPNSPVWIVAALAVLAAGGMLAPIDDLAETDQFDAALQSSGARWIITTTRHLETSAAALHAAGVRAILVDNGARAEPAGIYWRSLLGEGAGNLPCVADDQPAMLSWTSGTTGSPKAFVLTHRNIGVNVAALRESAIVDSQDRALLPLPLHHAYPLVVGMLTTLTIGTAIVLPGGATGPLLMRALREGEVTTIIGVPRLYEALWAALALRIEAYNRAVRLAWRGLLRLAISLRRSTGLDLGRLLFASVRRAVAPRLRLLVSGGARLDQQIEERLEALGWTVLTGYGLAETASLFTGNRPNDRRAGSAGRPLADGEIRIAEPDGEGVGEIELRGASITTGYLDNPEANRAAFTADGWFRTGDLGFLDRDAFLFVTGRVKETLVLGGGKKVSPEDLERVYGEAPEIAEIALLEDKGGLVALVRPDPAKLYGRGATNLRDGIRVILGEKAQFLPSYERLAGFSLTDQPLPRTRLGKYRRFLLPVLYAQALAGGSARPARLPTPEDEALLRDPAAAAVWRLLGQRFPNQALDLDINLSLDLNLDSFGWMELAILLQERVGIALSDEDLGHIATIRDLLRLSVERGSGAVPPRGEPGGALDIEYWLAPTGLLLTGLGAALYAINRLLMRGLFRLRVKGADGLPVAGAFVIAPNHVSYLDSLAVAAALSWSRFRHTHWAGDAKRLFPHPLTRVFCRAVHLFPVDAMHPSAALDAAHRVLKGGDILVWFPEGWRSPDGRLQHFLPGIGQLLVRGGAAAVPAYVGGTFEAWPRGRRIPRWHRLTVRFGQPAAVESLRAAGSGATDEQRVADELRQRMAALAEVSSAAAGSAAGADSVGPIDRLRQ
jgi:long-chain acyl-CoA synthetase